MTANCLGPEPVAGPTEAADHLIGDQKDLVRVADPLDFGPIAFGRYDNAAGALHGFGNERGDLVFAQFGYRGFKLAGAGKAEVLRIAVATLGVPVGLVDMMNAGDR